MFGMRHFVLPGGLTDGLLSAFARNSKIASLDLGNNRLGDYFRLCISFISTDKNQENFKTISNDS